LPQSRSAFTRLVPAALDSLARSPEFKRGVRAKENGYWKILSWRTGIDDARPPVITENVTITRIKADAGFAAAAQAFLHTWLFTDHRYAGTFRLSSIRNCIGDAADCDARARGAVPSNPLSLDYNEGFSGLLAFATTPAQTVTSTETVHLSDTCWRTSENTVPLTTCGRPQSARTVLSRRPLTVTDTSFALVGDLVIRLMARPRLQETWR
jgi:hypothetical protein